MDRADRWTVGIDVDKRGNHVGSWLSQALALRDRYRGQWFIAATGATGATALIVARWLGS